MDAQQPQLRNGPDHLVHKPEWPEARERYRALWAGEIVDRACIAVTAVTGDYDLPPKPESPEALHTDIDYALGLAEGRQKNVYFGGEAIPFSGSSLLGYAAFGGRPEFREPTIWIHPAIDDYDDPYRFDPDNPWCRRYIEVVHRLVADGYGQGTYMVGASGTMAPLDVLNTLRGTGSLCLRQVDPRYLFIRTSASSVEAADQLLERARRRT
ncbi:MAG: hypothetical protein QGI83_14045 [Candidatus Latescibacteria bacterium]|jgi:hypothetical protein|nr:hypothetical protein [Candidatus Latescibacterota bacterium]